jgi:hypothetical protein
VFVLLELALLLIRSGELVLGWFWLRLLKNSR